MKRSLVRGMFMIALGLSPALNAQSLAEVVDKTIVYIKCKPGNGGEPSTGSGVLVSVNGHVLTALHLIPGGKAALCTGAIGGAGARHRPLVWRKASADYDVALLQFTPVGNEIFEYLKPTFRAFQFRLFAIYRLLEG